MFSGLDPRELGRLMTLANIGMEMVIPIGVGLLVDWWLGTLPWFGVVGVFLGFTVGLVHLIQLTNRPDSPQPPEASRRNKDQS